MKKALIIIILLVLIGTLGIVGYNLLNGKVTAGTKTLTSDDNKYSMEIPSSWNVTDKASSIGLFAAENRTRTMYVTLSVNTYTADGATLEDYISAYMRDIAGNSDDPSLQQVLVSPAQATYGENSGYYFELQSTADGIAVHLRDFVFITNDGYVHIDVASSDTSEDAGEAAAIAESIFASVRYSAEGRVSEEA